MQICIINKKIKGDAKNISYIHKLSIIILLSQKINLNGDEFMYDISLNENGVTFKALEKIIYKYACKIACDVMKQAL